MTRARSCRRLCRTLALQGDIESYTNIQPLILINEFMIRK